MLDVSATNCCGILDIGGVADYDDAVEFIKDFCEDRYNEEWPAVDRSVRYHPIVFYTDAVEGTIGNKVAKFIETHNLGTVQRSPIRTNPNTGNKIAMWVWSIREKELREWAISSGAHPHTPDEAGRSRVMFA
jgi:hypothetical protein